MLGFIILLIICFVVWPLVRGWLMLRRMRRTARQAYERASREAEREQRARRPGGWSRGASRVHKKKFAPSEGEYVEWEDVDSADRESVQPSVDANTDAGSRSRAPEPRVVDAEWEDVR